MGEGQDHGVSSAAGAVWSVTVALCVATVLAGLAVLMPLLGPYDPCTPGAPSCGPTPPVSLGVGTFVVTVSVAGLLMGRRLHRHRWLATSVRATAAVVAGAASLVVLL